LKKENFYSPYLIYIFNFSFIGVGVDYFKWQYKNKLRGAGILTKTGVLRSKRAELVELANAIEEHEANLSSIAMVFLKRAFLHVR
jgi:hypothetical protein